MSYISSEDRGKCHAIIHTASASAAAVGAGLAQIPCSDNLLITPIQLAMTVGLGQVFGLELSKSAAEAAIASAIGAKVGRTAAQILVGWMPGIGNLVNASTAAGMTETLGWILAENFARQARH